jgi:hypothetical protein
MVFANIPKSIPIIRDYISQAIDYDYFILDDFYVKGKRYVQNYRKYYVDCPWHRSHYWDFGCVDTS